MELGGIPRSMSRATRYTNVRVFPLPAPATDRDGAFISTFTLPEAPLGAQTLRVTIGPVSAVTSVTVTKSLIATPTPTPTPTPMPTPPPPVSPEVALQPLLDSSSLIKVSNFNNSTKLWTFFDPSPAATDTISQIISGQVYWINMVAAQTVTLNGKPRALIKGWNLLSW